MSFSPPKFITEHPLWQRLRGRYQVQQVSEADTVMAWPPRRAQLLSTAERLAYPALDSALRIVHPQGFLFAHVQLSRLVRVSARRSHKDWLARTAHVSADYVLCDAASKPLVVVMFVSSIDSAARQRRHDRVARVCEGAGIQLLNWPTGWRPEPRELRDLLFSSTGPAQTPGH